MTDHTTKIDRIKIERIIGIAIVFAWLVGVGSWIWCQTSGVSPEARQAIADLQAMGAKIVFDFGKPISLTFFEDTFLRFRRGAKPIPANAVSLIAKLTTLTRLEARQVPIDDEGMKSLAALTGLEYLDVSETKITAASCDIFARFKHLTKLSVAQNQIGDEGISQIVLCKNLASLDVGETGCTDKGIAALSALPKLKWLAIGRPSSTVGKIDQPQITDNGLSKLQLPKLSVLWCQSTGIRGHTLGIVPWRDTLTFLNADFTDFDDEGAAKISNFSRLSGLSLTKTNITDLGVASLMKIKTLKWLSLAYVSGITDKCIDDLLKLPRPIIINTADSPVDINPRLRVEGLTLGPPDELYPRQFEVNAFTNPSPNN